MEEYWFIFQNEKILTLKNITQKNNIKLPNHLITILKNNFIRHYAFSKTNTHIIHAGELDPKYFIPKEFEIISVRQALELLDPNDYYLLARAYSIIRWDKNHRYCGQCARETIQISSLFERLCEHCSLIFYPRISPSVIVLIQKDDDILMARSHHFPPNVYGLIAGFVDAGETLEQAVHREVAEEVGIKIKNLHYYGSQPWPFPDSLMIAFFAEYASGTLKLDPSEIEEANWYPLNNLPGRPSSHISIARKLIDHFIARKKINEFNQ